MTIITSNINENRIKKTIHFIILILSFSIVGYGQNHFIILIDGGGKTRSHENNPMLRSLLYDSIPHEIYNKGIILNDSTLLKANQNDYFSVAFYGLLPHNKVKHNGHKDNLQVNTLFPALKKVSIENDFIHTSSINYSTFNSKQSLITNLKSEIKKHETYWYGFASIADYVYMRILKDHKNTIQNTIVLIIVKDFEYNGEGIASERRFIKEHVKDYNRIADIFNTISEDYNKNEIGSINFQNINSYIFNFYPKVHDSIQENYPINIVENVQLDKNISEGLLLHYSIVLNEDFFHFIEKYKSRIDSISFEINIDNYRIPLLINKNSIGFYYQIKDRNEVCNIDKQEIQIITSLLVKDDFFGKKWIILNKQQPTFFPKYYKCEIRYWAFFTLKLIVMLFITLVLILYFYLRILKTEVFYDIENIGSHNNIKRKDKEISLNKAVKVRFYYEPKKKSKLWQILSKLAHFGLRVQYNDVKYKINDMPLVINLLNNESLRIYQKGIKRFIIKYKINN
jgi:hypothetical protein